MHYIIMILVAKYLYIYLKTFNSQQQFVDFEKCEFYLIILLLKIIHIMILLDDF